MEGRGDVTREAEGGGTWSHSGGMQVPLEARHGQGQKERCPVVCGFWSRDPPTLDLGLAGL